MFTMFYVIEHAGTCHLSVSSIIVTKLVGISVSLFQLSFISHVRRTDTIAPQLLDGKEVHSRP